MKRVKHGNDERVWHSMVLDKTLVMLRFEETFVRASLTQLQLSESWSNSLNLMKVERGVTVDSWSLTLAKTVQQCGFLDGIRLVADALPQQQCRMTEILRVPPDYTPEALADQVDWSALPGADELAVKDAFNMFAGYVTVDENNGRRIFYWFMEAQENAQEAPVVSLFATRHGLSED